MKVKIYKGDGSEFFYIEGGIDELREMAAAEIKHRGWKHPWRVAIQYGQEDDDE